MEAQGSWLQANIPSNRKQGGVIREKLFINIKIGGNSGQGVRNNLDSREVTAVILAWG
jgi:hypothetical protein